MANSTSWVPVKARCLCSVCRIRGHTRATGGTPTEPSSLAYQMRADGRAPPLRLQRRLLLLHDACEHRDDVHRAQPLAIPSGDEIRHVFGDEPDMTFVRIG